MIDIKVMANAAESTRVNKVKNVPVNLKPQRKRRTIPNPQDMDRFHK